MSVVSSNPQTPPAHDDALDGTDVEWGGEDGLPEAPEPVPASAQAAEPAPPPMPATAHAIPPDAMPGVPADDSMAVTRPVPRISVDAFCESPETGAVVQRAAQDRRLSRANVTVYMGGVEAALEQYGSTATPSLIILETLKYGPAMFAELERLAEVCDAATKVIVIGAVNDITTYREVIRQGVSEYLVPPFSPVHLIGTIAGLYADPDAAPIGRVYAFIGARGGVGSSTVAHNVAWSLAEHLGENTTVMDLDLSFGTAGLDFNQEPAQGVADALASPDRLDEVMLERLLVKCSDHLNLFTAPGTLDREYEIEPEAFESVVDMVRKSTPGVVLDLPQMWTDWTRRLLLSADQVVITAAPDLACLRNAKNMIDLLVANRPNDAPPLVVLNQVGMPKRPEIPLKDFAEAIGITPAFVLPFEPRLFGTAANNGQMIGELNAGAKVAQHFNDLARMMRGKRDAVRQEEKPKGLLASLFGGGE
jgi:pilus assembly protein CpaE